MTLEWFVQYYTHGIAIWDRQFPLMVDITNFAIMLLTVFTPNLKKIISAGQSKHINFKYICSKQNNAKAATVAWALPSIIHGRSDGWWSILWHCFVCSGGSNLMSVADGTRPSSY